MREKTHFGWVCILGGKVNLFDAFRIEPLKHFVLTKIGDTLVYLIRCELTSTSDPQLNAYSTSQQKAVPIKKRIISKSPINILSKTINFTYHIPSLPIPTKIHGSRPKRCLSSSQGSPPTSFSTNLKLIPELLIFGCLGRRIWETLSWNLS